MTGFLFTYPVCLQVGRCRNSILDDKSPRLWNETWPRIACALWAVTEPTISINRWTLALYREKSRVDTRSPSILSTLHSSGLTRSCIIGPIRGWTNFDFDTRVVYTLSLIYIESISWKDSIRFARRINFLDRYRGKRREMGMDYPCMFNLHSRKVINLGTFKNIQNYFSLSLSDYAVL